MGNGGGIGSQPAFATNRLELKDGMLRLNGVSVLPKFGRRGVQIGCHFVTYEALDRIHEESQQ